MNASTGIGVMRFVTSAIVIEHCVHDRFEKISLVRVSFGSTLHELQCWFASQPLQRGCSGIVFKLHIVHEHFHYGRNKLDLCGY